MIQPHLFHLYYPCQSVHGDVLNVVAQERIGIGVPNKKSSFMKRSAVVCESSQNNFRFNFKVPLGKEKTSTTQLTTNHDNFMYRSSDNGFRFNFVHPAQLNSNTDLKI
jgi:hypothetical protein